MREMDDMRVRIELIVDVDRGDWQLTEVLDFRDPDTGDWVSDAMFTRPISSAAAAQAGVVTAAAEAFNLLRQHLLDHDELTLPFG